MLHIALYEPKIAPNTGNIIRLAANNGATLHLIEPLGFDFSAKPLQRAGLDYHDISKVIRHSNFSAFRQAMAGHRILLCSTKAQQAYDKMHYQAQDVLLFGSETHGLPDSVMQTIAPEYWLKIPMQPNNRSLNLANAVAIISYEAWRQHGFIGAQCSLNAKYKANN
jgi:tRNA (cytidine/uridine-2'-O-)-methyltransferase